MNHKLVKRKLVICDSVIDRTKKGVIKRIVLVIDEYPYVARASKSLASTLQLLIDKNKDSSKLFLILCGSSMSYMEDHVLAYKSPLYGRRIAQLKIQPLEFLEACLCFKNLSDEDKAMAYGITGGTHQYLQQIDDSLSIEDNMFRFWYRFVPENISIISRGAADLAYRRILPELPSYMGGIFEDICKQYLWKLLLEGKCAVNFSDIGRWWGANPKTKSREEIDIMGAAKDAALFAECKWTNEKVDLGVLETLVERSMLFSYRKVYFYLFAKTGFTKGCIDIAAEMGNVTMITYKDMLAEQKR